jgi:hypothetical protein
MRPTSEMTWASFSDEERRAIKSGITGYRPYANRVSFAFATRLFMLKAKLREDHFVLDELDYLEGISPRSRTKKEEQFRHSPLHPFWHKHFSAPRHFIRNIGIQWGLAGKGNRRLMQMLQQVAHEYGDDHDQWPKVTAHKLVIEGSQNRSIQGLTGDWIIFGKHGGQNYYLDLAEHEEADTSQRLYEKLRAGNFAEFPFLFVQ